MPLVCLRNIFVSLGMQFGIWVFYKPALQLSINLLSSLHWCGNQMTHSHQVMTLIMHHQHTFQVMLPNLLKFHLLFCPFPLLRHSQTWPMSPFLMGAVIPGPNDMYMRRPHYSETDLSNTDSGPNTVPSLAPMPSYQMYSQSSQNLLWTFPRLQCTVCLHVLQIKT